MNEPIFDFVCRHLRMRTRSYQEIAKGSGVPKRSVEKIARGERPNPSVHAVQKLYDYFRSQEPDRNVG